MARTGILCRCRGARPLAPSPRAGGARGGAVAVAARAGAARVQLLRVHEYTHRSGYDLHELMQQANAMRDRLEAAGAAARAARQQQLAAAAARKRAADAKKEADAAEEEANERVKRARLAAMGRGPD